jgi:hypothetical protein
VSTPAPDLDALDAELAALQAATNQLAVTLMALDDDTTRATLGRARGETAARWQPVSADLDTAWTLYPQLSARVDGLLELRGAGRRAGRDTVARLDEALHTGIDLAAAGAAPAACVRLTAAAGSGAADGAGAAGGSAGAAGGSAGEPPRLVAASLAAALRVLLAGVEDLLARVREAQRELLPRAEASVRALGELRGAVDGVTGSAADQAITVKLEALNETLAADPLSLSAADFDAVDETIASAHAAATSAEALRRHLAERLAAGRALLEALPALLAEARAARDLARVKIADLPRTADGPPGVAEPRRLTGELTALDALAAADQWRALAARLPAWSARVHAATDQAATTRDGCRALLAQRDELRGRLGAYRAKAQAYGLAEEAELIRLADLAHGTLYTAPCDLAAAGQQVGAYAAAVAAVTAASRPIAGRTTGSP